MSLLPARRCCCSQAAQYDTHTHLLRYGACICLFLCPQREPKQRPWVVAGCVAVKQLVGGRLVGQ
jgi:hypothetical protein